MTPLEASTILVLSKATDLTELSQGIEVFLSKLGFHQITNKFREKRLILSNPTGSMREPNVPEPVKAQKN